MEGSIQQRVQLRSAHPLISHTLCGSTLWQRQHWTIIDKSMMIKGEINGSGKTVPLMKWVLKASDRNVTYNRNKILPGSNYTVGKYVIDISSYLQPLFGPCQTAALRQINTLVWTLLCVYNSIYVTVLTVGCLRFSKNVSTFISLIIVVWR